ncbi:MAG: hypothetical protein QXU18_14900 [Thermoplasmatales archaeon]
MFFYIITIRLSKDQRTLLKAVKTPSFTDNEAIRQEQYYFIALNAKVVRSINDGISKLQLNRKLLNFAPIVRQ